MYQVLNELEYKRYNNCTFNPSEYNNLAFGPHLPSFMTNDHSQITFIPWALTFRTGVNYKPRVRTFETAMDQMLNP